jgi:hypothetical protein
LPWSTWAMMAMLRIGVLMGADFLFFYGFYPVVQVTGRG